MLDGGTLIFLGSMLLAIDPAHRASMRRQVPSAIGAHLKSAFPPPASGDPEIDRLATDAGDVLDDLDRGVIATSETYTRAARRRRTSKGFQ